MTTYRPTPKSKASTLIERLSHATAGPTNEVLVKRLEQDAQRLMSVDAVGAHTVLGGTASLRWDADAVHDHYRIALQHRASAETHYNYSIALGNIAESQAAFDAAANALEHVPDDRFLVDHAIGVALQGGRFSEGRRLCERWRALVPKERHPLARRTHQLADAAALGRFSEDAVRRLLAVMEAVQQGERIRGVASATIEDPREPGTFLHEQHVHVGPPDAGRLNAEFVARIASQPDLMEDPGFTFVAMFVGTDI